MNERVKEIVEYIVNEMQSGVDDAIIGRIETLSQKLMEQGYTETEIDSAFSWLIEELPLETDDELLPDIIPEDHTWYSIDKAAFSPAAYIRYRTHFQSYAPASNGLRSFV